MFIQRKYGYFQYIISERTIESTRRGLTSWNFDANYENSHQQKIKYKTKS